MSRTESRALNRTLGDDYWQGRGPISIGVKRPVDPQSLILIEGKCTDQIYLCATDEGSLIWSRHCQLCPRSQRAVVGLRNDATESYRLAHTCAHT
jgi:hypothetical protein